MRVTTGPHLVALALACGGAMFLLPACEAVSPEVLQQRERTRRETDLKRLVGMTRDAVRAERGKPDRTQDGTVQSCWGPQEALWSVLGEGTPYEEWVWTDGKWLMYAWFAAPAGTQADRGAWKVVEVGVGRTDVVY